MTSWVRSIARRLRPPPPVVRRVLGEPEEPLLGRFRRVRPDVYVDESGAPVRADLFPDDGDADRCLAIARLEASLPAPFAPVIAFGPAGQGWFAIVTGDGADFFRSARTQPPSAGVAAHIGQQILSAGEIFEDAFATSVPLRRSYAIVDGSLVVDGRLVLRAPLRYPTIPGGRLTPKIARVSPEQARGVAVTGASHQFIAALTVVEIISARHCFQGDSEFQILESIRNARIVPSLVERGLAADLAAVLTRMLAPDPRDRFATLHDARTALDRFAAPEADVARWLQISPV